MKHTKIIIVILVIILIGMLIFYFKDDSNNSNLNLQIEKSNINSKTNQQSTTSSIEQNGEIKSALTEKIETHAGYYLSEIYVESNQLINKDTNILKYTNGEYLVAPYDCYITEIQLPQVNKKCLNSHYIQIESSKMLSVSINISQEQIEKISVGKEVEVRVSAVDKTYKGYITNIGSSANNGKFEVDVEFENDGNVKLGMTGKCKLEI